MASILGALQGALRNQASGGQFAQDQRTSEAIELIDPNDVPGSLGRLTAAGVPTNEAINLLSSFGQGGDPFTLSQGQRRFGPGGEPIASVPPTPQPGFTLGEGQQRFNAQAQPIASVDPQDIGELLSTVQQGQPQAAGAQVDPIDQEIQRIDAQIQRVPEAIAKARGRANQEAIKRQGDTLEKRRAELVQRKIRTEQRAFSRQVTPQRADELITGFEQIKVGEDLINDLLKQIDKTPGDFGASGSLRNFLQTGAGIARDIGGAVPLLGGAGELAGEALEGVVTGEGGLVARNIAAEGRLASFLATARQAAGRPLASVQASAADVSKVFGARSSEQVKANLKSILKELKEGARSAEIRAKAGGITLPDGRGEKTKETGEIREGTIIENDAGDQLIMRNGQWQPQ